MVLEGPCARDNPLRWQRERCDRGLWEGCSCDSPATHSELWNEPRQGCSRGFAKGVAGTVSLPIFPFFSVFFRFPFSSVFFCFFPVSFRFLPFFSVSFQKNTGRHRSRDPFWRNPDVATPWSATGGGCSVCPTKDVPRRWYEVM